MKLTLGMVVGRNIGKWLLKLNKYIYRIKQKRENSFEILGSGLERRFYHQSQMDSMLIL